MYPLYRCAPEIWIERAFYALFPIWKAWFKAQRFPACTFVQAIAGYATEPFNQAEKLGALKVADCPNSHPASAYALWQGECDRWCPGEKVPLPNWIYGRQKRELERADLVLCPSEFVRHTMVANGLPASKCFINPFGADTGIFQPRHKLPTAPRFISVGTISLRKGHQYLFRAFEQVKKLLPNAELICVGRYKADFRKERPQWEGRFLHYPSVPHSELAKLLQTCTAFVLASVEEGFARALAEAMAAGLPIIATPQTGATTLVRDGVEGLIVPARDPPKLAEAILRLASDAELCRRMGQAAYLKGSARNTWQDYGDRLLEECQRRLDESGSPRVPQGTQCRALE